MSVTIYGNYLVLSDPAPSEEALKEAEGMLKEQGFKEINIIEETIEFSNKLAKLQGDGSLYAVNYPAGELVRVVVMKCQGVLEDGAEECR